MTSPLTQLLAAAVSLLLILTTVLIFWMRNRVHKLEAVVSEANRNRLELLDKNVALTADLESREALAEAGRSEWGAEAREFFDFIRSSKRGTCTSNRLADVDVTGGED